MLDSWKRPGKIYADSGRLTAEEGVIFDLAQDVITDCSVVASLCSAIAREERSLGKVPPLYYHLLAWGKEEASNSPRPEPNESNGDARLYQI